MLVFESQPPKEAMAGSRGRQTDGAPFGLFTRHGRVSPGRNLFGQVRVHGRSAMFEAEVEPCVTKNRASP